MHDTSTVCGFKRVGNLRRDGEYLANPRARAQKPLRQRLALNQFHNESKPSCGLCDFMQCSDVRVIHGGEQASFPAQPLKIRTVARKVRCESLERHITVEQCVVGSEYLSHPTGAKTLQDDVMAKGRAGDPGWLRARGSGDKADMCHCWLLKQIITTAQRSQERFHIASQDGIGTALSVQESTAAFGWLLQRCMEKFLHAIPAGGSVRIVGHCSIHV
jgi:hypothetical protein